MVKGSAILKISGQIFIDILKFCSGKWTSRQKKDKTERVIGLGKRTRGDSKVESNDSPEIPDREETSDIPGLPSGVVTGSR